MDNRFTFKDFVFAVLIVVVIGAVGWMSWQYSYEEQRLNDVKRQTRIGNGDLLLVPILATTYRCAVKRCEGDRVSARDVLHESNTGDLDTIRDL